MHRALERFSGFAATAVVFVYLIGLGLGTANYFVGTELGISHAAIAATGLALAIAVEVHSFLSQRLTRSLWQLLNKLPETAADRDAALSQFRTHLAITLGLVGFSIFNGIAFWATVMHPTTASDWAQVAVRGTIIPIAFLSAGFLVPLHYDASHMLATAAALMLNRSIKVTMRQWRSRLAAAERARMNLAPVAAVLMEDAGESDGARRLRIIDRALTEAEAGRAVASQDGPSGTWQGLPAPLLPSDDLDALGPSYEDDGAASPQRSQPSGARRKVRTMSPSELEAAAFALLDRNPRMSRDALRRKLSCSTDEASRLRTKYTSQMRRLAKQSIQLVPDTAARGDRAVNE